MNKTLGAIGAWIAVLIGLWFTPSKPPAKPPPVVASIPVPPPVEIPATPVVIPEPVYESEEDTYLCEVYRRTPIKKDASGDFTNKDKDAAARAGMSVCEFVIGGLNPEFKTKLVQFGRRADSMGIKWSLLSAFRDDYRQRIASGIKAKEKNSMHGGSRATKGYRDGRAADITVAEGPLAPLITLMDTYGKDLGIQRPYTGFDPQHVQWGDRPVKKAKPRVKRVAKKKPVPETTNF